MSPLFCQEAGTYSGERQFGMFLMHIVLFPQTSKSSWVYILGVGWGMKLA